MFALDPFGRSVFAAPRRALGRRRAFMGQAPATLPDEILPEMIAPMVRNRLAEVPVDVVRSRRQLLLVAGADGRMPATLDDALAAVWSPKGSLAQKFVGEGSQQDPAPIQGWSRDDYAALVSVYSDPAEEELEDLALIDGFWAPKAQRPIGWKGRGAVPLMDALVDAGCGRQAEREGSVLDLFAIQAVGRFERGAPPPWMPAPTSRTRWGRGAAAPPSPFAGNPFFCGQPQAVNVPRTMGAFESRPEGIPGYFGIDSSLPWEEVKGTVLRSIAVMDALSDYPFPPPINVMPQVWYMAVQDKARGLVRQDIVVDRSLVRLWATMAVIESYNDVSQRIVHKLKQEAKRKRRKGIIRAVAIGVALTVVSFGLAAAFAAIIPAITAITATAAAEAVTAAIGVAISAEDRKKAAQEMEKTAKQFEKDAPAFAAEARKAAQILDYQAAQEAAAAPLTQEELEAIAEGEVEKEVSPEDTGGPLLDVPPDEPGPSLETLLIGGGVAAAVGTAAALLL